MLHAQNSIPVAKQCYCVIGLPNSTTAHTYIGHGVKCWLTVHVVLCTVASIIYVAALNCRCVVQVGAYCEGRDHANCSGEILFLD